MSLHICRKLQVLMPVSAGSAHGMQALTKQATATYEGETLVNRAYNVGTGKALINPDPTVTPVVKINGVVSGCVVAPTATNNDVSVTAGVVNINGVAITVSADAGTLLVRPATSKYAIYAFSVAADGTTFTATKGTDGDALDWTAYGGAGQMPLCPAANAVIAYIWLYSDVAAVVPAANIIAGESANLSYEIDYVRGNLIVGTALPLSYTGAVARPVFMSWQSQDGAVLQAVMECESAKLDIKTGDLNVTPASAGWERHEPGRNGWTASISEIKTTDNYRLDQAMAVGSRGFIKIKINASDAYYFIGQINMTGISLDLKFGELKLPYSFQGSGELCRVIG